MVYHFRIVHISLSILKISTAWDHSLDLSEIFRSPVLAAMAYINCEAIPDTNSMAPSDGNGINSSTGPAEIKSTAKSVEGNSNSSNAGTERKADEPAIGSIFSFFGSLPGCVVLSFCIQMASYGALGTFDGRMNLAAELICYCTILVAFGLTAVVLTWIITFCVARFRLVTEENLLRLNENLYQGTLSVISGLQVGMVKLQQALHVLGQTPKIVYTKLGGIMVDITTYTKQLPTTLWSLFTTPLATKEDNDKAKIESEIPMGDLSRKEVVDTAAIEDIEKNNKAALEEYKKNILQQRESIESRVKDMNRHWETATFTQRGILFFSFGAMVTTAVFLALKQQVH